MEKKKAPSQHWKKIERKVARELGTERTPLSGSASRLTASDTLHPKYFVEVKYRKKWALWTLFVKTHLKAAEEKKIPILVLKEKGQWGELYVMMGKTFLELYDQVRKETE